MLKALQNKKYLDDLTVRMAHHNTALEGNTLSQDETASIILNGIIPKATSEREYFEVKNYKNLIPFMLKAIDNKQKIDNGFIKEIHTIVMDNLIYNKGEFKKTQNMIVGATFDTTEPYQVPYVLKDWADNLNYCLNHSNNNDEKLEVILSHHIRFEKIHPFSDGNGRVGRALVFYSCLEYDTVPFIITKDTKDKYIHFLRQNDMKEFVDFAKDLQQRENKIINLFKNNEPKSPSSHHHAL